VLFRSMAWRNVCAVIATVHNNREFSYGDQDNAVLLWLRKWAYRRILNVTDGVIAVSRDVKQSLIDDLGIGQAAAARITVVTNAVPQPPPIDDERKASIRQEFGCGDDDLFVLAAGRFCEQKNYDDLLTIAGHLRQSKFGFRFVIGGEGEQWQASMNRIQEDGLDDLITLPGNLTNLDEVMQSADVFVMTSLWEGLPLVLLEAMAAGLPAVAYQISGVVEVLEEGESGLMVPVGETAKFADILNELAGNKSQLRAMSAASKARVAREFGFDQYIAKLVAKYFAATELMKRGQR